jgi:hypothetical protein
MESLAQRNTQGLTPVCVTIPCFGLADAAEGHGLSVSKRVDNGQRPLGPEGSGFSG